MDVLKIGRAPDNNLVLDDASVSRYHARIDYRSGRWHLDDLNSSHGTKVNGKKIEGPVELKPSDKIMISEVKMYFDGRALFSAEGKQLLVLRRSPASSATPAPFRQTPGQVLPGRATAIAPKRSKLPAIAGLSALILVFAVLLIAVSADKSEPQTTSRNTVTSVPQDVVEYKTFSYDGGEYTGWLKAGIPHGQGTIRYPADGGSGAFVNILVNREKTARMYEGEWRNGLKHGYGKMTYPSGMIEEGYWENGQFVGRRSN
jgi:hypothetical protein